MKKLFILSLLLVFSLAGIAQDTNKEKDIRKFLELTGSGEMGVMAMQQMISSYKQAFTNVPDEFWDEFMKKVNPNDLIDLVVPIYDKYYTEEDIKALIAFYQTPIGQKTIKLMPQISQESMKAGEEWGMKLGEKIAEEMKAGGY